MESITNYNYVNKILEFWFEKKIDYIKWFKSNNKYDKYITEEFFDILKDAEAGYLLDWLSEPNSYLAMIILLDQFSRHIYIYTKDAYKNDKSALLFTEMALDIHIDKLTAIEKCFVLMPYQHSENINNQQFGIRILENLIKNEDNLEEKNILKRSLYHHEAHLKVIKKFDRFPKRNIYLDRESTEEEIDYMDETYDRDY
jgi:uncharacterized protein (DUF924 family)